MPKKNERRPIKGFPNYEVDRMGNVYSLDHTTVARKTGKVLHYKGRKLRPCFDHKGYYLVWIVDESMKSRSRRVNRLVAEAFIPNPNNYPVVNHKDEDKTNNRVENLEWCTNEYNLAYGHAKENHRNSLIGHNCPTRKPVMARKRTEMEWVYYPSMLDAGKELGIDSTNIGRVCKGQRSHANGYVFKYAEVSNG